MDRSEQSLTDAEVRQLAALVRERLEELGDPEIRVPDPSAYIGRRHWMPHQERAFSVTIDAGATILTLYSPWDWPYTTCNIFRDLPALSRAIVLGAQQALNNTAALAHLAKVQAAAQRKIKRDRLPLTEFSVRLPPIRIGGGGGGPGAWVHVDLLDDMLLPYRCIIDTGETRELGRGLKNLGEKQARRLATIERLKRSAGVLEIEAMAEHAILTAGRTISDVVGEMLRRRTEFKGYGPIVTLWGEAQGREQIQVLVRDGCIKLVAGLKDFVFNEQRDFTISHRFPEIVRASLAGAPLRTLFEHPFFSGEAEIEETWDVGTDKFPYTKILMKSQTRPIPKEELQEWPRRSLALPEH